MNLEQLNLSYLPQEDRILFRIGFSSPDEESAKQEIKILLTRRLVQRLWPTLIEALLTQIRLNQPGASFASQELIKMQHQHSVETFAEDGNFSQDYDAENRTSPLGETPLLLDAIKFHLDPQKPLNIQFIAVNGTNIDLKMPMEMVHGFCKLLQEAVRKADWELDLSMLEDDLLPNTNQLLN
jgi:hypothetical protein